uniref:Centromere protein M n=1 Tax=Sus scrofa TaxID=9823 RepID=A0A8D0UIM6_PIG
MSVLRPMDKLPGLNTATILLVGTEDALLQQLADSMLKEDCASELKVHLANSLPLPSSVTRPRIDLIVFVINLHSKHSLRNVEESLHHVDATFFLGKVSFLVTGAGRESHCSIHRSTVVKLAHTYRSPLLFCDLEVSPLSARHRLLCSSSADRRLPSHHGTAPGPHAADLRRPRAGRLGPEPAVPAEELREPLPGGPVRATTLGPPLPIAWSGSVNIHCCRRPARA